MKPPRGPVLLLAALLTYRALVRPRLLHWGATVDEAGADLPGDELMPHPDLTATRAITIHAAAADVWPWIAQLGQGRGGFYSYDALENLIGCDIHSVDQMVPEWQDVEVGARFALAPEVALSAAAVEPGRALVVRGAVAMESAPAPYDFTWTFVLREVPDGPTRLVVRERYGYRTWWVPALVETVTLLSFVMSRRMLHGIKERAEQRTAAGSARGLRKEITTAVPAS
jgi:hypothetical protein